MKIEIKDTPFDTEVKRFYAPIEIHWECTVCNADHIHDMSGDYLSYPTFNQPEEVYLYCDECEEEHSIELVIGITAKIVSPLSQ